MRRLQPKYYPPTDRASGNGWSWNATYMMNTFRYRDRTDTPRGTQAPESFGCHKEDAPWPHTIGMCSSGVCISDVESGPTRHELKAIVEVIVGRIMHKEYGLWNVYPVCISP